MDKGMEGMTPRSKAKMQRIHCEKNGYPQFAPPDGVCYWCGRQIYDKISEAVAQNNLITGCPWCYHSYCE
jgi:uncharacterized Zn finger protein (UPF0148 family)